MFGKRTKQILWSLSRIEKALESIDIRLDNVSIKIDRLGVELKQDGIPGEINPMFRDKTTGLLSNRAFRENKKG